MAIDSVTEDWKTRKSEKSLQDGITGTRVFNVYSDSTDEIEANVYSAVPVELGDLFPGTLVSQCVSQSADRNSDDRTVWTVTCQYKSILNQVEQQRVDYPNPLDRKAAIEWTSRTVMKAVTRMQQARNGSTAAYSYFNSATFTFDGTPYLTANTAKDLVDPPLEKPVEEWIASVRINVTEPPEWLETYANSVNDSDIKVGRRLVKKGCGAMGNIRIGSDMKENGVVFVPVSFEIITLAPRDQVAGEADVPEPWDIEILNEGMRTYGNTAWRNITDILGQAVSKPVPLATTGYPIDITGAPIPEASLTWLLFRNRPRKSFLTLPGVTAP